MHLVGKVILGVGGAVINYMLWLFALALGYFNIMFVVGSINSVKRFSHSKGSMFDLMALQSATQNPFQNAPLHSGIGNVFYTVAGILTLCILLRIVTAPSFRHAILLSFKAWTSGLTFTLMMMAVFCLLGGEGYGTLIKMLAFSAPLLIAMQLVGMKVAANLRNEQIATPFPVRS
jgi:hypothetical protein